jgi:hypothetical protein
VERNSHHEGTPQAVRPAPVRHLVERIVNPHGNATGHSHIPGIVVAEVISEWMDGATLQWLADHYNVSLKTILHWVTGINRPSILAQVEKVRRKAGLPIRYTRNIAP